MAYLGKRVVCDDSGYCYDENWWYSETAEAIKWAVVVTILALLVFCLAGYLHARRRVRAGQAPLKYHRWLLPRRQRMHQAPQAPHQQFTFYGHQQAPHEMQPYPAPPPAYHQAQMPPPPRYEPPQGASKTNPDQQYMAPPGPPPPPAAESSRSVPPSPVSPIDERQQPMGEQFNTGQPQQFNAGQPQQEATQLPPRPEASSRSWNPLKRFK
ncbi:MAG: hypothetical protein Q9185_003756 [Variospora sp. 1 TL-2023]